MNTTGLSPRSSAWLAFLASLAVFLALARPLFADTQSYAVKITAPANNTTVTAGTAVTVTVAVSGNASPIAKVDSYDMLSSTIVGTATSAPF